MNTKLTLTIEQEVIERAKKYASEKNRSLSDIIENYLRLITKEQKVEKKPKLNSTVETLRGSFKMPHDMDYKNALRDRRETKYL